ncbi:MAG: hypothetical protein KC635_30135, partial [Myxococcales bacterium]|nr:hypothetical protein [Myxococcales bacterium]
MAATGKAKNNAAICYFLSGDLGRAADTWQDALGVAERSAELGEQTILLNNVGYMHLERGAYARAADVLADGLELATRTGDSRVAVALQGNLGAALT